MPSSQLSIVRTVSRALLAARGVYLIFPMMLSLLFFGVRHRGCTLNCMRDIGGASPRRHPTKFAEFVMECVFHEHESRQANCSGG